MITKFHSRFSPAIPTTNQPLDTPWRSQTLEQYLHKFWRLSRVSLTFQRFSGRTLIYTRSKTKCNTKDYFIKRNIYLFRIVSFRHIIRKYNENAK